MVSLLSRDHCYVIIHRVYVMAELWGKTRKLCISFFFKTDVFDIDCNHFNRIPSIVIYGYVSKPVAFTKLRSMRLCRMRWNTSIYDYGLFYIQNITEWLIKSREHMLSLLNIQERGQFSYLITEFISGTYILTWGDGAPPFHWHREVSHWLMIAKHNLLERKGFFNIVIYYDVWITLQ